MSISSDSNDESIDSSVSYIILSDTETADTASPTAILEYSPAFDAETAPFEAPLSPDYAPTSNADTEPLEAPASPDYTLRSDTESEPSEHDPKESEEDPSEEDPFEEDLMEYDEPLPAQATPALPAIVAAIIQLGG
ncbi:hypothetical protein Tco_0620833 [Tanacetum coccineum]